MLPLLLICIVCPLMLWLLLAIMLRVAGYSILNLQLLLLLLVPFIPPLP